jgi:hypothetical protein
MPDPEVRVELREQRGKLYAQAVFATDAGDLVVDHIYCKPHGLGGRPRVELPSRPDGRLWVPILRIPDAWFAALVSAIDRAMQS